MSVYACPVDMAVGQDLTSHVYVRLCAASVRVSVRVCACLCVCVRGVGVVGSWLVLGAWLLASFSVDILDPSRLSPGDPLKQARTKCTGENQHGSGRPQRKPKCTGENEMNWSKTFC